MQRLRFRLSRGVEQDKRGSRCCCPHRPDTFSWFSREAMNSRGERYLKLDAGEPRFSFEPCRQLSHHCLCISERRYLGKIAIDVCARRFPPFAFDCWLTTGSSGVEADISGKRLGLVRDVAGAVVGQPSDGGLSVDRSAPMLHGCLMRSRTSSPLMPSAVGEKPMAFRSQPSHASTTQGIFGSRIPAKTLRTSRASVVPSFSPFSKSPAACPKSFVT